jgi:uncharacterized membrane protein YkvA (DUF1232 family)
MAPKNTAGPAAKRATRSSNGKAPSKPTANKAVGRTNGRAAANGRANTPGPQAQADNKLSERIAKVFARSERQAGKVIKDPKQTQKLAKDATQKADERRVELGDVFADLQTLLRLTSAYAKGDYRVIPARTIVGAVGAVIYFVSPVDAIPDVIPGIGLVDDAAVLYFVVKAIATDLDDFRRWEDEQTKAKARTPRPRKPTGSSARTPRRAAPKSRKPASGTTAKTPTPKPAAPKTAPATTRKAAEPSARKA